MAYNLPQVQAPDIVGAFQKGKQQPLLDQLNKLKVQQVEQSLELGKKKMNLAEYQADQQTKQDRLNRVSQAAKWAQSQPNPDMAFNEAVQFEAQDDPEWEQYRGGDIGYLSSYDGGDPEKFGAVHQGMIGGKPGFFQVGTRGTRRDVKGVDVIDESRDISKFIESVPEESRDSVAALIRIDKDAGLKLASDLAKAEAKPLSVSDKKEINKATAAIRDGQAFLKRMDAMIFNPKFSDAVGVVDQFSGQWGAMFGTEEGLLTKQAMRAEANMVLDAADALKGTISDKDMETLERTAPKIGDDHAVWVDWYESEFKPRVMTAIQNNQDKISVFSKGDSKDDNVAPDGTRYQKDGKTFEKKNGKWVQI